MKATDEKSITPANKDLQSRREPFFTKEGQDNLFSKSNKASTTFFSPLGIQPKLTFGKPNDKYEVEADTMADKVVSRLGASTPSHQTNGNKVQTKCKACMKEDELQKKEDTLVDSTPGVQRKPIFESNDEGDDSNVHAKPNVQFKCASCEKKEMLQREANETGEEEDIIQEKSKAAGRAPGAGLQSQLDATKGGGFPLSPETQNDMGAAFGADFSQVRIHTDNNAIQMNNSLNSQAFTHKNNIYFSEGKFDARSTKGKHLLAHELTHVVQQGKANSAIQAASDSTSETQGHKIADAIRNLELSLGVAETSLLDDSLESGRKAKIESLYLKLRGVLLQLYDARGTDGSGVVLDFDTAPELHEINPGDAFKPIEELYYPFSVSHQVGTPNEKSDTSSTELQAKLINNISSLSQPTIQRFCDPLVCVGIIVLGGLLLSGCNRSSSGSIGPTRLRSAIGNFDSNNLALTAIERTKIQTAMAAVVGSNEHLLISFYDYYSNKEIIKDSSLTGSGTYATTMPNDDTRVDPTILSSSFSDNTLGGLLIHEYTHTRHHTNFMGSRDYEEGDSYGIEYFFAERTGDTSRISTIAAIASNPTSVVSHHQVSAFRSYFCKSYGTMKVLYEIIDSGRTSHSGSSTLSGLTGNQARALTTELVSKREEDHSTNLTSVITWVSGHTSALGIPFRCS